MKKRMGNIERALISECVRDVPSFTKIGRLFEMGADPNAVNEYGECVLGIVMEGYCSLYGTKLRSGFFAPMLISVFLENGFNVRRHALKVVSELQNGCYDRYMRQAISMLLKCRSRCMKQDYKTLSACAVAIFRNLCGKKKTQAA